MKEMKYIVVKVKLALTEVEEIYLFQKTINHDYFAENISNMRRVVQGGRWHWDRIYAEPISAGFKDGITCYGGSETLGLYSRPEDTVLLNNA